MPRRGAPSLVLGLALFLSGCAGLIGGKASVPTADAPRPEPRGPVYLPGQGSMSVQKGRPGHVVGAPHGTTDSATDVIGLELAPVHTHAEPGAQRLERRLLGREARGEVGNGIAAAPAVGDLVIGEHAAEEAIVPALHHAAKTRDLGEVDTHALDVRHEPMAFLMIPDSSAATDSICDRSSPSTITRARFSVPE